MIAGRLSGLECRIPRLLIDGKMYLHLFHGRDTPDEQLDDWGFDGPQIGPLQYAHTTYGVHIKLGFENVADAKRFGLDPLFPEIPIHDAELAVHEGKYYGDWSVYIHRERSAPGDRAR